MTHYEGAFGLNHNRIDDNLLYNRLNLVVVQNRIWVDLDLDLDLDLGTTLPRPAVRYLGYLVEFVR